MLKPCFVQTETELKNWIWNSTYPVWNRQTSQAFRVSQTVFPAWSGGTLSPGPSDWERSRGRPFSRQCAAGIPSCSRTCIASGAPPARPGCPQTHSWTTTTRRYYRKKNSRYREQYRSGCLISFILQRVAQNYKPMNESKLVKKYLNHHVYYSSLSVSLSLSLSLSRAIVSQNFHK